jgi:hypothetical protein
VFSKLHLLEKRSISQKPKAKMEYLASSETKRVDSIDRQIDNASVRFHSDQQEGISFLSCFVQNTSVSLCT